MNTEIAIRPAAGVELSNEQLQYIASTEFVPPGLRGNLPAILACVATGRALGLPDMTALRSIHIIDGKATFSAELMVMLARQRGHSIQGKVTEGAATVTGKRVDNGDTMEVTWTLAMAERAGLVNKQNWRKYPESMLWARAVSQLCRELFPDCFAGATYTPEELGADETTATGDPLPVVDMADPDIPFGDAAFPEHQPPPQVWATSPQKKKLNVLVGKLRPDTVTTEQLWERMGKDPTGAADADGVLHWSPLRDSLSKREAHELTEWLEALDKGSAGPVEPTTAPLAGGGAPDSGQAGFAPGSPAEHILALTTRLLSAGIEAGKGPETQEWLEKYAAKQTPEKHLEWLENEVRKLDERMATA